MWMIPLVLLAGVGAGIVNTLAGGGSLFTLPLLIFLGLPAPLANGTNRVAIWVQCVVSTLGMRRGGIRNFAQSALLSIPAVLGSVAGAQVSVEIPALWFERIFAIIMVIMVWFIVWNPKPPEQASPRGWLQHPVIVSIVFFLIGIYGGMIQAGVGYFLTAALVICCRMNLRETASIKVTVVAIYTTVALWVFFINDQIDWPMAIVLSIGNGIGGWMGARMVVSKREEWIRITLGISVFFMALKLLGVFDPWFN